MPREITVLLKQPDTPPVRRRWWDVANDVVKSPLFGFIFGASFAAFLPALQWFGMSADQRESQRRQDEARADAALISPFLNNLDVNQQGRFDAARAALKELERSSRLKNSDPPHPMFQAVNSAIEAVAAKVYPSTTSQVTAAITQQIEQTAAASPPVQKPQTITYDQLREAVVYIEVDRTNDQQRKQADAVLRTLRANAVVVPGVEGLATSTMPKKTQVRYFDAADQSRAEQLAAMVTAQIGQSVIVVKPQLQAKPGTLELWFGTQSTTGS